MHVKNNMRMGDRPGMVLGSGIVLLVARTIEKLQASAKSQEQGAELAGLETTESLPGARWLLIEMATPASWRDAFVLST